MCDWEEGLISVGTMCICLLYLTLNSNVNHTIHIVSIRKKGSVISGTSSSSIFVPLVVVLNTCGGD